MFPRFRAFCEQHGLDRARGALSAVLPRILGQGKTRATELDVPPAAIERKLELASVKLPPDLSIPPDVEEEIAQARAEVTALRDELVKVEGKRRFIGRCLELLPEAKLTDGKYHVESFMLTDARNGFEWTWGLTSHYPLVDKLPPDAEYIARGLERARTVVAELLVPPDVFERRLTLAWQMARHFAEQAEVPVVDVMRCYQVAAQDDKFWNAPRKATYKDLPVAAFVANLVRWRSTGGHAATAFRFVQASLHEATSRKVFYMPMNTAGTEVRPMLYLTRDTGDRL